MEQAIKALGLNIGSYPEYIESYLEQTRLYLKMGEKIKAEETLSKALSIELCNTVAAALLQKICQPYTSPIFFIALYRPYQFDRAVHGDAYFRVV